MSPSPDFSPAALAETLLCDWEAHARPTPTPAYQAARVGLLARLTEFSALLLRPDDINLNADDARAVLRPATAFRLGRAATTGPARAARLGSLLAANLPLFPPAAAPATLRPVVAVLSLQSGPAQELEMDELTEITETVQQTILTPEVEMIFGHGISSEAEDATLLAWLLVGYAAAVPVAGPVGAPVVAPTPKAAPPPAADGRDPAFAEAAHLLVRHQHGSSSLLQRVLHLGYNRTCRLMEQLAQAGIVGPRQAGKQAGVPVLIADEAALMRHLAQLPPLAAE